MGREFKNCVLSFIRVNLTSMIKFHLITSRQQQHTRTHIYISKRQSIWFLLTIDKIKWCSSTFTFTVWQNTWQTYQIVWHIFLFVLTILVLGPKNFGVHTSTFTMHFMADRVLLTHYTGLGEWNGWVSSIYRVCVLCDTLSFHFH